MFFGKKKKKTIGITAGAFDLLHAGHLIMLEEVKGQCDHLIVCLQTDPTIDRPQKNKPVESMYERFVRLKACKFVDEIIPYDTEADFETILRNTDYDFRFLSVEYQGKEFTGKNIKPEKIYYNTRSHDYSSSRLRKKVAA